MLNLALDMCKSPHLRYCGDLRTSSLISRFDHLFNSFLHHGWDLETESQLRSSLSRYWVMTLMAVYTKDSGCSRQRKTVDIWQHSTDRQEESIEPIQYKSRNFNFRVNSMRAWCPEKYEQTRGISAILPTDIADPCSSHSGDQLELDTSHVLNGHSESKQGCKLKKRRIHAHNLRVCYTCYMGQGTGQVSDLPVRRHWVTRLRLLRRYISGLTFLMVSLQPWNSQS